MHIDNNAKGSLACDLMIMLKFDSWILVSLQTTKNKDPMVINE